MDAPQPPATPPNPSAFKSAIIPFFASDNLIISQQRQFQEQEFGCVEDMLDTLELKIYEKNYGEASGLISRIKKMVLEGDRYIFRVKNYRKYEELQRSFVGFVTDLVFLKDFGESLGLVREFGDLGFGREASGVFFLKCSRYVREELMGASILGSENSLDLADDKSFRKDKGEILEWVDTYFRFCLETRDRLRDTFAFETSQLMKWSDFCEWVSGETWYMLEQIRR